MKGIGISRPLLIAGGVINVLFFLFHIYLGYQIHGLPNLAPDIKGLMEALNVGGVLFIFLFAWTSLIHTAQMLTTGPGRSVLAAAALLYLSRAAEEFFLFRFTPVIFISCMITGGLYAILFAISLRQARG